MLKFNFRYLLIPVFLILLIGCRKEGTGGKSAVSGTVMHHEKIIPNAVVYIKYGAKELPGTEGSSYDASTTADANGHYEFKDLRKGDYFLYGIGIDGQEIVKGGISINLKYNKEKSVDVPVTE
ncbi:MAG: hypothetical protein K0Q95_37 [Bacteroidota bacterium]|nr:hypothetical protein [Bacteroidota bacterium]